MEHRNHTPDLLAEAADVVVDALRDGAPLTLAEMPRRWPVTRPMLTFLVREMLRSGVLVTVPGGRIPGQTAYALAPEARHGAPWEADDVIRLPRHDAAARATA